jgi:glyceraldehyde-3-phosphate dehydrogenase/erythrose-4-phosphate dehydrogenase
MELWTKLQTAAIKAPLTNSYHANATVSTEHTTNSSETNNASTQLMALGPSCHVPSETLMLAFS